MKAYLDHNATTPLHPDALAVMLPYFGRDFANTSSTHSPGRVAAEALNKARRTVARCLGAKPAEIVFTAGGSEANNLAIKGAADRAGQGHVLTTVVEHPSVLGAADSLAARGFAVDYLPVDREGRVSPAEVEKSLRPDTILVSVMYANNETGALQPIEEIGALLAKGKTLFHCDAVQAVGKLPVEVGLAGVDLLSLSGHKFGGPKGVGVLFVRDGVQLSPLVHGGGQEKGLIAGTSNTPGIVCLSKALEVRSAAMVQTVEHMAALRDRLEQKLRADLPGLRLNGPRLQRLPNTLNLSIEGVEGGALLAGLDERDVYVSGGAACHADLAAKSYVLEAMGALDGPPGAVVRFSVGPETTEAEVDYAVGVVVEEVQKLRARQS